MCYFYYFSVLSKANLEKMSLKALPECYRQKLKLPASYAKTPIDAARKPEDVLAYIPGRIQNILCMSQYD
jgi:hypothetical protein